MRISPLDFPQARMAPESVMRGLEDLDPSACVVHLGGKTWIVGKVRPNSVARGVAETMMSNWTRAVQGGKRLSKQGQLRVRFAQLALLGFRPVSQYEIQGEPDGRIVKEFEFSRHCWLTTSDNELNHTLDTVQRDKADAAKAQIADVNLGKEAWNYAFRTTHTTSVSLTPPDRPKSGFVRHEKPQSENTNAA